MADTASEQVTMVVGDVRPILQGTANDAARGGSSGPPSMSDLERRLAGVEQSLDRLPVQFLNLRTSIERTGMVVAFTLLIAGLGGVAWLADSIRSDGAATASRFDAVASSFEAVGARTDAVNARLDAARDAAALRDVAEAAREDARAAELRAELRANGARLTGTERQLTGVEVDLRGLSSVLERIEDKLDRTTAGN